jgi:thioredoxin-like negative regulator of GroEL
MNPGDALEQDARPRRRGAMSRASKLFLLLAVLAAGGLWFWQLHPGRPAVGWLTDPQEAFAAAKRQHKPVLVKFWQPGCAPCAALDREVFADGQIGRRVEASFVPLSVDVRQDTSLARRYGVRWTPALVVVTAEGALVAGPAGPRGGQDRREWFGRFAEAALSKFRALPATTTSAAGPFSSRTPGAADDVSLLQTQDAAWLNSPR